MTWMIIERTVCNLNKRELVQARDYIAYASVYHRALKERGMHLMYPLIMDGVFTSLKSGDIDSANVKISTIRVDISWEHFGGYLNKNYIGSPVLSYYTRKYLEVLEKASYHLWQARRS